MPAPLIREKRRLARRLLGLALLGAPAVLALTPPVFTLRAGAVRTLAYEPDGARRWPRVVGPLAERAGGEAWLADGEITPACRAALVAAEDVRFYRHLGVDPVSISVSLQRNLRLRRIAWGGSTLTQQIVKNVFLTRERSFVRKLREMLGAALLDRIMSKRRQITWYLNLAEFGPRVYGLERAAEFYYGRRARDLALSECVALFAILPDPVRRHRSLLDARRDPVLEARREGALRALARVLPPEAITEARAELARAARAAAAPQPSSARSSSSSSFMPSSHSRSASGSSPDPLR